MIAKAFRRNSPSSKTSRHLSKDVLPYFVVEKGRLPQRSESDAHQTSFDSINESEEEGDYTSKGNYYPFDEEDPDHLLELEDDSEDDLLDEGLEQVGNVNESSCNNSSDLSSIPVSNGTSNVIRRDKLHPPRTDAHRLSRANLEESGDSELDAILNELCALENQFTQEISSSSTQKAFPPASSAIASTYNTPPTSNSLTSPQQNIIYPNIPPTSGVTKMQSSLPVSNRTGHSRTGSGGMKSKFDSINIDSELQSATIVRTDSPDNDSAFSDNVSMLSSESSASSGASGGGGVSSRHQDRQQSQVDQAARIKAEKIKMALEKLKEAQVKKLFIKAFSVDGSSKSLLVDEKMNIALVTRMLADKNHVRIDPKWAIVEHLPDLYMERIYEDDEMLVDNLLLWTRDSKNKLLFLERMDKYDFFIRPENYMSLGTNNRGADLEDDTRTSLIEECFTNSCIPDVEGPLFLKSEGKKAWKKFYFVLRRSGLYYCPKGKSSKASKDLVCLATFESNQVYHGFNWKKKYKSPTDHCFALKHAHLQAKNSKLIKYLCAEDAHSLAQWVMGIRIAKWGQRLAENYRSLVEDIAQEDIDMLASCRSFSVASVSGSGSRGASQATTPSSESRSLDSCLAPSLTPSLFEGDDGGDTIDGDDSSAESSQDTPVNTLCRAPIWRQESIRSASSSSSSGCLSERSSAGTPTSGEHGFEADFPQGTIKRKPSGNPKIPLTSTTRHLVKEVEVSCDDGGRESPSSRNSTLRRSTRKSLSEEVNTLRRRNSSNQSRSTTISSTSSSLISSSVPLVPGEAEDAVEISEEPLSLPPPPPVDMCDADALPPPPPELLASTLSLNSLPPPPDESQFITRQEDLMTASVTSLLPPPPPPHPVINGEPPSPTDSFPSPPDTFLSPPMSPPKTPPKPKSLIYDSFTPPAVAPKPKSPEAIYGTRAHVVPENISPPPPPPPPPPLSYPFGGSVNPMPQPPSSSQLPNPPKSPQKKVKRITFMDDVQRIPPSPPSPAKPLPPRRSNSTRLSIPGKLDAPGCKITPPKAFLNNLQRVMQKKWQVAQKCRDFDQMPHEVLGFRDPLPPSESEKNVGAWIQEHYGSLYENLAPNPQGQISPSSPPPPPLPVFDNDETISPPIGQFRTLATHSPPSTNESSPVRLSQTVPGRKRPPPPPPKRADTTQLSGRQ